MATIIHFIPRAELDAQSNLRGFVAVCRNELSVFGRDLNFDEDVWDVTESIGAKAAKRHRLIFSTWSTVGDAAPQPLPEPFMSFAKAYMRYQHGFRPTKATSSRLAALRALEAALSENGNFSDPTQTSLHTLNRASQLCVERFGKAAAHRTSGQLEILSDFLIKNRLLSIPSRWRNPVRRPQDTVRVGPEFEQRRQEKLPSAAALSAVANIFRLAAEPADILVASVVAILCSAPDRISEVLYLEEDCEVTQTIPSSGKEAYGLRWRPAKGAEPMVKWVIPAMADVVKEAVSNIRQVTAGAREVARWYEGHPREIYMPRDLEHLRGQEWITLSELGDIVFVTQVDRSSLRQWCDQNGVERSKGQRGDEVRCRLSTLQAAMTAALPQGFPWLQISRGLKYSDALCIVPRNLFHQTRATYRSVIEVVTHGHISDGLGGGSAHGKCSLFDRHGFQEDDGTPIRVSTHQFRHYLNTLAQAGGLSQLDIAKWSGRKDIRQNHAYDHQSDRDVLALVRAVVGDASKAVGPLATVKPSALIPRDEFARLKVPTAHTTDFGYCIHDFSMLPCQIHRDCLNCNEHVCIKGDAFREANIRRQRTETAQLLEEAMAASKEHDAGANRWVAHHEETLERLEQLCAIFDNPNVPAGTVIQAAKVAPASSLVQASRERSLTDGGHRARLPGPASSTRG